MPSIECTLVTDGPSDEALLPILRWVLRQHAPNTTANCSWANLLRLPNPPRRLRDKISKAIELHPCQILFIHRDAEREAFNVRHGEIYHAVVLARETGFNIPHVCVVPVRMQEAWLLLNEAAIRNAAGNPNGRMALNLPLAPRIEALPDPKRVLCQLLEAASGLRARRLKKFRAPQRMRLVAEYVRDFSPLRVLTAFQRLETEVQSVARSLHLV